MSYGHFNDMGDEYIIKTPRTKGPWNNYFFNGDYYMEVSQAGQGKSMILKPEIKSINRGYRYIYILNRTAGECFCPGYYPLKSPISDYSCTHRINSTTIASSYGNMQAEITARLPASGAFEIWEVSVRNQGESDIACSVFSAFSLEHSEVMGGKCQFLCDAEMIVNEAFPYYSKYEDQEAALAKKQLTFCFADRAVTSYDCCERDFFGGEDTTDMPEALVNRMCSGSLCEGERPIGAMEVVLELKAGQSAVVRFISGSAVDVQEAKKIKSRVLSPGFEEKDKAEINSQWEKQLNAFRVKTDNESINRYANYWGKKQVAFLALSNRITNCCPVRNQLQDAMGYSLLNPKGAMELLVKVLQLQQSDGFIQQWYMTDGSAPRGLCLVRHLDGPAWIAICGAIIVSRGKNKDFLQMKIPYKDGGEDTLYNHLVKSIDYLGTQRGIHGLVLMGDGDWTDPVNGPGRLGRGESTWTTMALAYGILQVLPICDAVGDAAARARFLKLYEELKSSCNEKAWNGKWYDAGFTDDGEAFGSSENLPPRIFLNTQTWAIFCGFADKEKLQAIKESLKVLETPFGPRLLHPEFHEWDATWGRISVKLPGTTENGSVYCHASMFKALAEIVAGDWEGAMTVLAQTLPDEEKNLQIPIFLPNYYFGLPESPNYGRSSCSHFTGTASWFLWILVEHMKAGEKENNVM